MPSPYRSVTFWTVTPSAGATPTVNCAAESATGFALTASDNVADVTTTTDVFATAVPPPVSVAVADTV